MSLALSKISLEILSGLYPDKPRTNPISILCPLPVKDNEPNNLISILVIILVPQLHTHLFHLLGDAIFIVHRELGQVVLAVAWNAPAAVFKAALTAQTVAAAPPSEARALTLGVVTHATQRANLVFCCGTLMLSEVSTWSHQPRRLTQKSSKSTKHAPTKLGGQRTFPAKRSPTMKLQARRSDLHRVR